MHFNCSFAMIHFSKFQILCLITLYNISPIKQHKHIQAYQRNPTAHISTKTRRYCKQVVTGSLIHRLTYWPWRLLSELPVKIGRFRPIRKQLIGLFSDADSSSDYIASNDTMITEYLIDTWERAVVMWFEVFAWSDRKTKILNQYSWSSGRDFNPRPPKYKP